MSPATATQTVPACLHSMHTLCPRTGGGSPFANAAITARSCRLSTGQPRSSKSTGTWSEMPVDVASVEMNWGCA